MSVEAIYNRNSQFFQLTGDDGGAVTNGLDGTPVLGATGEIVEIVDDTGTPVTGATWPIPLTESQTVPGTYSALVPSTIALVTGSQYVAKITLDGGGGLVGDWQIVCRAVDRS